MTMAGFLRRADKAVQDTKTSVSYAAVAGTAALVIALIALVLVVAFR